MPKVEHGETRPLGLQRALGVSLQQFKVRQRSKARSAGRSRAARLDPFATRCCVQTSRTDSYQLRSPPGRRARPDLRHSSPHAALDCLAPEPSTGPSPACSGQALRRADCPRVARADPTASSTMSAPASQATTDSADVGNYDEGPFECAEPNTRPTADRAALHRPAGMASTLAATPSRAPTRPATRARTPTSAAAMTPRMRRTTRRSLPRARRRQAAHSAAHRSPVSLACRSATTMPMRSAGARRRPSGRTRRRACRAARA